ncbi:MAG: hypothetical protein HRT87_07195 [Legionellales bacterium]|nr:hypothetical protein [Legionellales bacterium]
MTIPLSFYKQKSLSCIVFLPFLFICSMLQASVLDLDLTGISYHIGANSSYIAYKEAPRKLDPYGTFVFNPGIGIGVDFRENTRDSYWHGFSPVLKALYLRDCDDRAMYFLNIGTRYRYMWNRNFSFDLNLALSFINAEKWLTNERKNAVNPYASFGFNYHLEKKDVTLGTVMSIVPKNKKSGRPGTNSFNIFFVSLYFGFNLA